MEAVAGLKKLDLPRGCDASWFVYLEADIYDNEPHAAILPVQELYT